MHSISVIASSPVDADYISLSDHQASTPASFLPDEQTVLHYKATGASFSSLQPLPHVTHQESSNTTIYVSISDVIFWFADLNQGIRIPYQCIILHAIQSRSPPSIYFQIDTPGQDGEMQTVEMVVSLADESSIQQFYTALSDCSSLHPDAAEDGDEEPIFGGNNENGAHFGPWITAESLQNGEADDLEPMDEEDDEAGPAGLEIEIGHPVQAAGVRRERDDDDSEIEDESAAGDDDNEASKWRRTN